MAFFVVLVYVVYEGVGVKERPRIVISNKKLQQKNFSMRGLSRLGSYPAPIGFFSYKV